MDDPHTDALTWDNLTWQDIQAIALALAERHAGENVLTLAPDRLARLVDDLPGFAAGATVPDDFILSAIVTAWISAEEGDDDSSPYDYLA
jgi:FeS assembly protein IscX